MDNLFRPAISLMDKLRYPHKFMVLVLIYLVAVAVVFFSLYTNLSRNIRTSQRELVGLALIKPTSRVAQLMQQHRGLELGLLVGNKAMQTAHNFKEDEVTEALAELARLLPPDLALDENWKHINAEWGNLRAGAFTGTLEESFSAHTSLIEQIHTFTVIIADLYGLTLDDSIDSYYSIDTSVNALPGALEKMGQMRAYGTQVLASKQITKYQQQKMLELITELRDAFKVLDGNLKKTGHYNPAMQVRLAQATSDFHGLERQITNLVIVDVLSELNDLRQSRRLIG